MGHNEPVTSRQAAADPKTTLFLLGVATIVAQALLLREAMAAMGGSEIAWGTVMALWLLGMGLGTRIVLLNIPFKFDVAWNYNFHKFSKPKYYISLGLDF